MQSMTLPPSPKVLLGGKALDATDQDPAALGYDAVAHSALEAVREACRLVGLTEQKLTPSTQSSHLRAVILSLKKSERR